MHFGQRLIAGALVAAGLMAGTAIAARQTTGGTSALETGFSAPPDDARIMMRWWWFGPSVTREQAEDEMRRMKAGGIGGFEIATVYPMAVDDAARGIRNYHYLSAEYLDLIGFTARKARELGLRMDVTLGSGWSFGGPHITPELAAARLRSDRREITPDISRLTRPVPYEHEQLIAAFVGRGSVREVDASTFEPLDISGTGAISVPPGPGPRTVLFYFASRTGQIVKRPALGAEGYVLDHYQRPAIEKHLREVGDKLIAAAGPLTELYEERFLLPIRDWSRRNNVRFRIQGYGAPPAALSSYQYADLFDGEGFEWRMLSRARWAASAAHLFGKPVVGSETWTWIHSPAFRATPLDLKGEADQHFLSGVNQLIGHGWPASPPQAGTPGWPFYAAGVFTDRNPWWPVMPDLAAYLQRVSFLLRQGAPVADIAVYAPTGDARAAMRPGAGAYLNLWSAVNSALPPGLIPTILESGYSFDAIDDGTLAQARSRAYKAIVLPGVRWMPDATREWLEEYSRLGGTIIAVERLPEGGWPPLQPVTPSQVQSALRKAAPPDVALSPGIADIGFVHRDAGDDQIYFLANTSNRTHRVMAHFRSASPHAELWDPMTGTAERIEVRSGSVTLEFEPYASRVVVFRSRAGTAPIRRPGTTVASDELPSNWTLTLGGTSLRDVALPHSWADAAGTRYFSGTGVYRRRWDASPAFLGDGVRVYLDFGPAAAVAREALADGTMRGNSFAALVAPPVREALTVFVNDRRAGTLWAPPYRLDITPLVRGGSNEIRVEVYNTAINMLAEGNRIPDVGPVTEQFGQRFRLQDMDVLNPLPSGLLRVPRIIAERGN